LRRFAKLFLFLAVSTIAVLLLGSSAWAVPRPMRFRYRAFFQDAWGRVVRAILGIQVEVHGMAPNGERFLVVSNHLGYLDIPVLAGILPVSFIAKSEVAGWPLLGFMARAAGTLFVDRDDRRRVKDFVTEASARLRSGENLLVFPEGTSSRGETILLFKSAVFNPVERAPWAAIVPVALELREVDGRDAVGEVRDLACWHGDMWFFPHFFRFAGLGGARYEVCVGRPIPCAGMDRKALAAAARDEVVFLKGPGPLSKGGFEGDSLGRKSVGIPTGTPGRTIREPIVPGRRGQKGNARFLGTGCGT
jgi:1-acyl-sn-glycerol-3-phosphate acyltransferase